MPAREVLESVIPEEENLEQEPIVLEEAPENSAAENTIADAVQKKQFEQVVAVLTNPECPVDTIKLFLQRFEDAIRQGQALAYDLLNLNLNIYDLYDRSNDDHRITALQRYKKLIGVAHEHYQFNILYQLMTSNKQLPALFNTEEYVPGRFFTMMVQQLVRYNRVNLAKQLLNNASFQAIDAALYAKTIMLAMKAKNNDAVKMLLDHPRCPPLGGSGYISQAVLEAVKVRNKNGIKLLLNHNNCPYSLDNSEVARAHMQNHEGFFHGLQRGNYLKAIIQAIELRDADTALLLLKHPKCPTLVVVSEADKNLFLQALAKAKAYGMQDVACALVFTKKRNPNILHERLQNGLLIYQNFLNHSPQNALDLLNDDEIAYATPKQVYLAIFIKLLEQNDTDMLEQFLQHDNFPELELKDYETAFINAIANDQTAVCESMIQYATNKQEKIPHFNLNSTSYQESYAAQVLAVIRRHEFSSCYRLLRADYCPKRFSTDYSIRIIKQVLLSDNPGLIANLIKTKPFQSMCANDIHQAIAQAHTDLRTSINEDMEKTYPNMSFQEHAKILLGEKGFLDAYAELDVKDALNQQKAVEVLNKAIDKKLYNNIQSSIVLLYRSVLNSHCKTLQEELPRVDCLQGHLQGYLQGYLQECLQKALQAEQKPNWIAANNGLERPYGRNDTQQNIQRRPTAYATRP